VNVNGEFAGLHELFAASLVQLPNPAPPFVNASDCRSNITKFPAKAPAPCTCSKSTTEDESLNRSVIRSLAEAVMENRLEIPETEI
jgi:hypothetical protein